MVQVVSGYRLPLVSPLEVSGCFSQEQLRLLLVGPCQPSDQPLGLPTGNGCHALPVPGHEEPLVFAHRVRERLVLKSVALVSWHGSERAPFCALSIAWLLPFSMMHSRGGNDKLLLVDASRADEMEQKKGNLVSIARQVPC